MTSLSHSNLLDFHFNRNKPSHFHLPSTSFHIVRPTGTDEFFDVNVPGGIDSIPDTKLVNDDQMTTVPVDVDPNDEERTSVAIVIAVFFLLMVISVISALITLVVKRVKSKRKSYVAVPAKKVSDV